VKYRRSVLAGAILLALALVATACGSSGGSDTSSGATTTSGGGGGDVRGVTDTSVSVAALVSNDIFGAAAKGAQARFDVENAKGGVNGRKIDMVEVGDDKFDPTTNIQEARRLVSQTKVFAVVPTVTVVLGAGDYLKQQKVPFFGWGITAGFCDNEYGYGFTGCVAPAKPEYTNTYMVESSAKALKKPVKGLTVAVIAEDTDAAKSGVTTQQAAAESVGAKVVYAKGTVPAPPATVGDFSPFVQDIMKSNGGNAPDAVIMLLASIPSTLGLQAGLLQAGYKGPILNTQTYDSQLAAPSKGGSVYVQFGAFESAGTVKGVQDMLDAFKAATVQPSVLAAVGYFSADMFIAALKKAGKALTVESFQKAAGTMTYEVKDTVGPTTFPLDFKAPTPCGSLVTSTGAAYELTVPYFCAGAPKL
jgi:ABC-type branched-subunit amino acid transport system substrate-binding protein